MHKWRHGAVCKWEKCGTHYGTRPKKLVAKISLGIMRRMIVLRLVKMKELVVVGDMSIEWIICSVKEKPSDTLAEGSL